MPRAHQARASSENGPSGSAARHAPASRRAAHQLPRPTRLGQVQRIRMPLRPGEHGGPLWYQAPSSGPAMMASARKGKNRGAHSLPIRPPLWRRAARKALYLLRVSRLRRIPHNDVVPVQHRPAAVQLSAGSRLQHPGARGQRLIAGPLLNAALKASGNSECYGSPDRASRSRAVLPRRCGARVSGGSRVTRGGASAPWFSRSPSAAAISPLGHAQRSLTRSGTERSLLNEAKPFSGVGR